MRCRECNVDLPETYTACPLCGAKASPDEPVLKGIRTAEFPKLKTEPFKKDPFHVFLVIWLVISAISIALCATGLTSKLLAAGTICTVALVWTLLGRPFLVKQLYAGNYIVMNWLPLALFSVAVSKIQHEDITLALTGYLPISSIAVLVALTVLILAKPKRAKRAAAYPVLFAVLSVIASVITIAKTAAVPFLWLAVIVICACILALLFFMDAKATKEEIRAKFSIQRSVNAIKKIDK